MSRRVIGFTVVALVSSAFLGACSSSDSVSPAAGTDNSTREPDPAANSAIREQSFIWDAERGLQVIPLPPKATSMIVTALNDAGQVVGFVTLGEGTENYRAFMWSVSGGYKALGSLLGPDGQSMAFTISSDGEVRGLSVGPNTPANGPMGTNLQDHFAWSEVSGMRAVEASTLPFEFRSVSRGGKLRLPLSTECLELVSINAAGEAIGYAGSVEVIPLFQGEGPACRPSVAMFWEADGSPVEIAQCGDKPWCATTLRDINNRGEVVGFRDLRGFRWTKARGLLEIPMSNASLTTINDNGDAAGLVGTGTNLTPLVWLASGEIRKIELPAGAEYGFAVGINERGRIIGNFRWIR